MKDKIVAVEGLEVLDSRGNPTVQVCVTLEGGVSATAAVPSGASTGENEAVELRDGDPERYGGKGVLKAVAAVNDVLNPLLKGRAASDQEAIDKAMIECDGTENKGKLGANALLGVSMAVARAAAMAAGQPLYRWLGGEKASRLPVPMMNILNGGEHADNSVDFQEFMVMPIGSPSFSEALRCGTETFHELRKLLIKNGYSTGVGDEGGFAPNLSSDEEACELIVEAIKAAGYKPGIDASIALDPAASELYEDGRYNLDKSNAGIKSSSEMTALYKSWAERFPLVSIEDGLDENDWDGFKEMTTAIGDKIQIVGDDLFVTNVRFVERGIKEKAANAVLIKLNQIGTVSETIDTIRMCQEAGWGYIISHRSGETEDAFIADLSVAMGGGQIKTGSACRGERTAKYNRLLTIEAELGAAATFSNPFA